MHLSSAVATEHLEASFGGCAAGNIFYFLERWVEKCGQLQEKTIHLAARICW